MKTLRRRKRDRQANELARLLVALDAAIANDRGRLPRRPARISIGSLRA